jgi:hypothetical protein
VLLGVPRFVPLRPKSSGTSNTEPKSSDWVLDEQTLRAAFTPKTKMIILNTPHNPVGKVFTRQELETISRIVKVLIATKKESKRERENTPPKANEANQKPYFLSFCCFY